jgi:transcription-repair coupling factor (superfamily II helicase)
MTAQTVSELADILAATAAGVEAEAALPSAAQGLFIATLQQKQPAPTLVLTADSASAKAMHGDISLFAQQAGVAKPLLFPAWETLPHEFASPLPEVAGTRMAALMAAARSTAPTVVAPVSAVLHRLPTPGLLARFSLDLAVGTNFPFDTLTERLNAMGYQNAAQVTQPGNYALRGDILDIYPPHLDAPVRAEWFGDEIDTLRAYDPVDQRSTGSLERVLVAPVTELPDHPDLIEWAQMTVADICEKRDMDPASTTLETGRLARTPRTDGIETWAPFFFDEPMADLGDHLPPGLRIVLSQGADVRGAARGLLRRATEAMNDEAARGTVVPEMDALFVSLAALTQNRPLIALEQVGDNAIASQSAEALGMGPITPKQAEAGGAFKARFAQLKELAAAGPVTVVCPEQSRTEAFAEILDQHQVPHGKTGVTLATGSLSAGFAMADGSYLNEAEIFGRQPAAAPPPRAHMALFLSTFDDLRAGDPVVHIQHGIGLYRGLKRLTIGTTTSDYLELEYLGGDRIYVAMEHLHLVQKYQGGGDGTPPLDRMGGKSWEKKRSRAKKALTELAHDLVELHAARELARGHAFAAEGPDGIEFAASFPYTETPDQQRAIDEVRADMERDRPMDRLVCGDVGYGKTEVAIRAAFKAMLDGKQVALIAPTTLLAQQHFITCQKRFAAYPFKIAALTRFQGEKDRKVVNKALADGTLDLVVATHKILSKQVDFKRLGLLIVDEEQRFGVAQKERIKQWKTAVDVLTLTATPIPRTLQLSLIGVREMSIIDTPPPNRQAVQTKVTRFDTTLIQEAMERELERDGQVFFVHNRVQDIGGMAQFLTKLMPKANIAVAHGQMPERQLETVMSRFISGEANVLLSTSIIESGLDIPRANTIIINRADRFGLAELYQLRGRVGRSATQAYAFLMGPEDGWSGEAKERLMAIQAFTDLGSGFRIAARDLEIRGAGSLLGHKQSGQIAAMGIDAYMDLIREAMADIRGETVAADFEPDVKLGLMASIPDEYITDGVTRLAMYKRIASLQTEAATTALAEELTDRFGASPEPVQNLLGIAAIKIICRGLRLAALKYIDDGNYQVVFDADNTLSESGLAMLLATYGPRIQFTSETAFKLALNEAPDDGGLETLITLLKGL